MAKEVIAKKLHKIWRKKVIPIVTIYEEYSEQNILLSLWKHWLSLAVTNAAV